MGCHWCSSAFCLVVSIFAVLLDGQLASGRRLKRAMCQLDEPQDVVIVLDSSTSIARPDFTKQLAFVRDLVNQFKIGPSSSQVGIISFSNNEQLNFHLNRYKDKAELKDAILKIKQIGGGTNTHKPLEYARTKMFVPSFGDRPGVRNLLIVITDGSSNSPRDTQKQAELARAAGIETYALGIGPAVVFSELLSISGEPKRTFEAKSFDELAAIIEQFKKIQECPFAAPEAPVITKSPAGPVSTGEKVKLRCTSAGQEAETTLVWFKDDIPVEGAPSRNETHHISELEYTGSEDGANFRCEARHPKLNKPLSTADGVDVLPGPPVITGTPTDAVGQGARVRLTATSLGTDKRTRLVWFSNGVEVDATHAIEGDNVVNHYEFDADDSTASAKYEAKVIHPLLPAPLVAQTKVDTFVLPGPPIIQGTPVEAVAGGTSVTLRARSLGTDPQTKLIWYKDGQEVDRTHAIQPPNVVNEFTFVADGSQPMHIFEARVTHPRLQQPLTDITEVHTYVLPGPPVITGAPDEAVTQGTRIRLTATSLGTDTNTQLLWYKNGQQIDDTYIIQSPNVVNHVEFSADAANAVYEARVTHPRLRAPLKTETSIYTIDLPGPPIITGTPEDAVEHGTSVTLRATSRGTDKDTRLAWYQDERELDNSFAIQGPNVVNEYTFTTDGTKPKSTFEARVTHPRLPAPLSASTSVDTYTLPGPPTITGTPEDAVEHGTSVTLRATSRGTHKDTRLVWYQDGRELDNSFAIQGPNVVNEYTFTTNGTKPKSTFEARVTHPRLPAPLSASTSVDTYTLPGPPTITGTPEDAVEHGTSVTLRATSRGTHKDTRLVWYEDGRELDNSSAIQGPTVVNEYTFIADGTKPKSTFEARVTHPRLRAPLTASTSVDSYILPGAPVISGQPDGAIAHGTRIRLTATSLGTDPQTELLWFKDGQMVDSSYNVQAPSVVNHYEFVSDSTTPDSVFEARVLHPRLRKPLVSDTRLTTYVLPRPPIITGTPKEPVERGTSVTLTATSLGTDPETQLVWYRNGEQVDASYYIRAPNVVNEYTFEADGSETAATYQARVTHPRLRRPLEAVTNIETYVLPGPPIITGAPQDAMEHGSSVTLKATTLGTDPQTQLIWYQDGKEVDRTFAIQAPSVTNEHTFVTDIRTPSTTFEARVTHPRLAAPLTASTTVHTYVLPGPPVISGAPGAPIVPGQRVSLVAHSLGRDPDTRLIWYRNGQPVDSTYNISGPHVINHYEFTAVLDDSLALFEAKVHHPRLPESLVAETDVEMKEENPGPPIIIGLPKEPVEKDYKVRLQCRSTPAINGTRLVWYKDGAPVDDSFQITDDAITNDYSFAAGSSSGNQVERLECRVIHPRLDTPLIANGTVVVTDCNLRSRELDVLFLIDSSSSIYELDFKTILNFLSSLVSVFNVGPNHHRVGAAIFSDRPYKAFFLNEFTNLDHVQRAIRSIRKVLGSTHTDRAITYLHNRLLLPSGGARIGVPKVAFIITDGHSYDPQKTAEEAKKLRQAGVTVYAIAIGTNPDPEELLALAGRQQGVFEGSFSDLQQIKADIEVLVKQCRLLQPADPVDGGWTSWEPSGACSVTCGEGLRTMTRECSNPPPSNGGRPCAGATSMVRKCRAAVQCRCNADNSAEEGELDIEDTGNGHFEVNDGSRGTGPWSSWSYGSACSVTCGGAGIQTITRKCLSPFGDCEVGQVETKTVPCQSKPCAPVLDACGGRQGADVLLIALGNTASVLALIRNVTTVLPIDGQHVRLSMALPDCVCRQPARPKHRGFTLRQYSHTGDILRHLDALIPETRPTLAAIIKRARVDNGIFPNPDSAAGTPYDPYANRGREVSRRVAVIFVDDDDVANDAVSECEQLKMAGFDVLGISVGRGRGAELLASEPATRHHLRVGTGDASQQIYKEICRDTYRK